MRRKAAWIALGIALSGAGWTLARACAPDFVIAVFTFQRHPDLPRSRFVSGDLGVFLPTYARSYLVVAYRYLSGIGLNSSEQEQVRDYYKDRDTGWWDRNEIDWSSRWRAARDRIPGIPKPADHPLTGGTLAYDPETHSFALNCADDAYRTALHTLQAREARFGTSGSAVREWLQAQNAVFENCDGTTPVIPDPAPDTLPALIRADRQYQIAAAHFYAGNYDEARAEFARIAGDASSPWRILSRYLVVRTLLRLTDDSSAGKAAGAALQKDAEAILADPHLQAIHGMTANLLYRYGVQSDDRQYFRLLAQLLISRGQGDGLREELWNYTDLYDRIIGAADPNPVFRSDTPSASPDRVFFEGDDLSAWIFDFQARDSGAAARCLAKWRQTHALPWLVATLAKTNIQDAERYGLPNAARAVPASSPGRLTVTYYYYRLLLAAGDKAAVRDGIDAVLRAPIAPSEANLFRGLRMMAAPDFQDFLKFAVRHPVLLTTETNLGQVPDRSDFFVRFGRNLPRLDRDSIAVLNRQTPLRLLREAALSDDLPSSFRREFALTAFTRSVMLDQDASDLARRLREAAPELTELAQAYEQARTQGERRFAAAFLLLHHPEARPYYASGVSRQTPPGRIDDYRDNWWCPMSLDVQLDSMPALNPEWGMKAADHTPLSQVAGFLSPQDRTEADAEFARLSQERNGTEYLGSSVIAYARQNPFDNRIPEALHLVVRSGRVGCTDTNSWKTTRAAFRLLHRSYPHSSWSQRTPIWSDGGLPIREVLKR